MLNALRVVALPLSRCESCDAVAIRGAYCADHAIACVGCGEFYGADELRDGTCARCWRNDCEYEREEYASWKCFCGSHKGVK